MMDEAFAVCDNKRRHFAQIMMACMAACFPIADALAQDTAVAEQSVGSEATAAGTDGVAAGNETAASDTASAGDRAAAEKPAPVEEKMQAVASEKMDAYESYKRAAERYKKEINSYRFDLRRSLMSEYQNRMSSVDNAYAEKIATLRKEEAEMRDSVIERMEVFLKRYGDKHEKSADILYRLARLHYERADELYLSDETNSMEYPDFSQTLHYIAKLQQNFPNYNQMDGALYLKGYCQGQMGQQEESRNTFMELLASYPDSKRRAEVLTRIGEYYFAQSQDAILGLGG